MGFYRSFKTEQTIPERPLTSAELKRRKKQEEEALMVAVGRTARPIEEKRRVEMLFSNPTAKKSYVFHSGNETKKFNGIEYTEFSVNSNQPVFHGTIKVYEYNPGVKPKVLKTEDIYVYQPRLDGSNYANGSSLTVGPRFRKNNALDNRTAYAFKDPTTGKIYVASIPKREVISNRQFDFDLTCRSNFLASCGVNFEKTDKNIAKIISIDYDLDQDGYIRPVNLANQNERAKFNNYLASMKDLVTANSKLDYLIELAKQELAKAQEMDLKIQEEIDRLNISESLANKEAEAANKKRAEAEGKAKENEELMNDLLRKQKNMMDYGIRPTYASPGMTGGPGIGGRPGARGPMPMGPRPGGPMGGGPGFPPPPGGGGRRR